MRSVLHEPDPSRVNRPFVLPTVRRCVALVTCAYVLAGPTPLLAQKTDVIVLYRGDRITGEVKSLDRGKLEYKTDDMGTLSVKWDKVAHVESKHYFEVEDEQGTRHFGRLAVSGTAGEMFVVLSDTIRLVMMDVVAITPIKGSFWGRLDGYVDIGLDFQRANRNRQLNGSAEVRYRGERWAAKINGSTYFQRQEGTDGTSRNNMTVTARRLFGHHWSAAAFFSLEQNQELNLDRRRTVGAGPVRDIVRTNSVFLQALAALAWADEAYADGEGDGSQLTLPLGIDFGHFRFDSPKTDITSTLTATPVLTDLGRWRIDFSGRVSYELVSDFTVGFRVFYNYDSRPPSATATGQDYGITISLGYTF